MHPERVLTCPRLPPHPCAPAPGLSQLLANCAVNGLIQISSSEHPLAEPRCLGFVLFGTSMDQEHQIQPALLHCSTTGHLPASSSSSSSSCCSNSSSSSSSSPLLHPPPLQMPPLHSPSLIPPCHLTLLQKTAPTIEDDAGVGVAQLVRGHTRVVAVVLLRNVEEGQRGQAALALDPHSLQPVR